MIFRGQVTIFNPHDYPDMTSGGVIDFLVSPRKHRSVELEAIVFYSIRNIIPYPLEKRDCVFQDEMTSFHMFYTYSDCIVDCKIEDIWNICRCVPFFLPNRSKNHQWFIVVLSKLKSTLSWSFYSERRLICVISISFRFIFAPLYTFTLSNHYLPFSTFYFI